MKNAIYFILLISLLSSCKQDNKPVVNNEPPKESTAAKLEDLTKIDTATFLNENPQVRSKELFGPKYENLSTEKRIYTFKSRVYFGMNMRKEGSLASRIMKAVFQDTSGGKPIIKIVETNDLKFMDGQSKLEGTDSDDMKIVALSTYIPGPQNVIFKVNVNTSDVALRKARLESLKQALTAAGADIAKYSFDENTKPEGKEGTVSFEVESSGK